MCFIYESSSLSSSSLDIFGFWYRAPFLFPPPLWRPQPEMEKKSSKSSRKKNKMKSCHYKAKYWWPPVFSFLLGWGCQRDSENRNGDRYHEPKISKGDKIANWTPILNTPRLCLIQVQDVSYTSPVCYRALPWIFLVLVPAPVSVSTASLTTPTWNGKKIWKNCRKKY